VFSNLNFWELGGLLLLALFLFGPERLPKVISDAMRMVRTVRDMARNATADLSRELGTEVRLEDLHPKAFIRKHLLSEEEGAQLRRPFDDAYADVKQIASDANGSVSPPRPRDDVRDDVTAPTRAAEPGYGAAYGTDTHTPTADGRRYDSDAT
jgi:sec-independent protein translocase protein TatB